MRYLFKVPTLPEQILIFEEVCNKLGPSHQDVPLPTKEDLDGSIFSESWLEVLLVRLDLIHITEERKQCEPKGNGRYVRGLPRGTENEEVDGANYGGQD